MRTFFTKALLKAKIEFKFYVEQNWGIRPISDPYSIPKYILRKYLPNDPVIIDCGAHIGADSVELAKIFPKGTIHSFEPIPAIFQNLKNNTRKFQNIHCYQIALSDKDGVETMHVSSGSSDASSSLLSPAEHLNDHVSVRFDTQINVNTLTLDSWAKSNNIGSVDFLWLDMQGFEYRALKNSALLSSVSAIHTEVSLKQTYEGATMYPDFKKWLSEKGFKPVVEAIPAGTDMGNVLFVRDL